MDKNGGQIYKRLMLKALKRKCAPLEINHLKNSPFDIAGKASTQLKVFLSEIEAYRQRRELIEKVSKRIANG